jgi:transposase
MVYIKSNSNQTMLLPTNLRDIIPKDHICFLIEEVVSQVDFRDFDEKVNGPGNPTYHPRIILKIILNGVCERITSSRKLEKQTMENIVFRYLSENLSPDFHTIAMFRKDNRDLIKRCFLQTVEIAKKLDMVNFNKLYLDGIKVKANASKSKTFTKEEIDFLSEFVDKQFEEIEKADKEEDKKYGESNGEIKIPEHLTHKRKLQEKVKEMLEDIRKAKEKIDKAKAKIENEKVKEVNMTDMDSRMMKMKKGIHYEQAYNCQLLVEGKGEIIVGNNLSNSPTDIWETKPTMEKFKQDQKVSLKDVEIFQDNGYSCSATAEYYEKEGAIAYIPDPATTKELHGKAYEITKFDSDNFQLDFEKNQAICPAGHRMDFARKQIDRKTNNWTNVYKTRKCKNCEFKDECGRGKYGYRYVEINPQMRKIRLRFKTKEGIEKYNQRFHKGEIAQAHIEHNLGYREFKCRGNQKCENEVNLFSTAYNLVKIYKKWKESGGNLNLSLLKILLLRKLLILNINRDTACSDSLIFQFLSIVHNKD